MMKALAAACCLAAIGLGCTGQSEVKTKNEGDQPFGVYQGGIDRARDAQQQAGQRAAAQDSAAAAGGEPGR